MKTLALTRRPAMTGRTIPVRTEIHGDDDVPALTVPMKGIILLAKDLNALYNDEQIHELLFKYADPQGTIFVPRLSDSIIVVEQKFKNAKVTIKTERMKDSLVLRPATVKGIILAPQASGGAVFMNCVIMGAPDTDVNVMSMTNKKCYIAISGGEVDERNEDNPTGELDLDVPEQPTPKEDEDEEVSRTGRKIQAAARKAKNRKLN